jgi:hypothetical protein
MKKSWIDHVVEWGTTRRVPWWALVAAYAAFQALGISVVRWIDGSLAVGEFTIYSFDSLYGLIPLLGYGLLSVVAAKALIRFRPALEVSDDEFEEIRHQLTTTRSLTGWIVGGAGIVLGVVALVSDPEVLEAMQSSVLTLVFYSVFDLLINVALSLALVVRVGILIRQITRLHRSATHIDLFHPGPAHAFATVTATAAASIIFMVTVSGMLDPATFENPVWIGFIVAIGVLSTAAFFLPLNEMRRRLKAEKRRLLDHTKTLIGDATGSIESAFAAGKLDEIPKLKTALDVFNGEEDRIDDASTWPWDTGTLRGFATTLLLPVITYIATRLAGETLGL